MPDRDQLVALIESSDLNGLVRFIDGLVTDRDWPGLVELRDRCDEATERGKQVWGAAQFAEYRLALDAPAPFCTDVIRSGAGRFALGPLWEVAASTHPWTELATTSDRRQRTLIAHERALRGDDVPRDAEDRDVVDTTLGPEPWEPSYPLAVYRPDKADFPELEPPDLPWVELPPRARSPVSSPALDSLLQLVQPWLDESNGRAQATCVEGSGVDAIRALGPHRARVARVDPAQALAAMVWTAASGGAHGRRRGTVVGRGLAWWALGELLGFDWEGFVVADDLATGIRELEWQLWDPGDQTGGWGFHLAVTDPRDGLAWAISAVDAK